MTSLIVTPAQDEADYALIEAAVMETARGRWFLAEFARRNRHADTQAVLGAIQKLQDSVSTRPLAVAVTAAPTSSEERLKNEILDMARAISAMQREIRAISACGTETTTHVSSADELDSVVSTTEQATTSILAAAERVQEFAWTLRENAGNAEDCDLLDRCATDIYTACGFQDLTSQRIAKVVEVLRFVDQRLRTLLVAHDLEEDFAADEAMIAECAEPAPAKTDDIWMSEAHQAEIDDTFAFFEPAAQTAEPTMVGAEDLVLTPTKTEPVAEASSDDDLLLAAEAVEIEIEEEDAAIIAPPKAPEDPYAELSTPEKLRAFR